MKTTKLFLLKVYWIITKFILVKFYGYDVFLHKKDSIVHNKLMLMMLRRKRLKTAIKKYKELGDSYKFYLEWSWTSEEESKFKELAMAYVKIMTGYTDKYVESTVGWFLLNYGLTTKI